MKKRVDGRVPVPAPISGKADECVGLGTRASASAYNYKLQLQIRSSMGGYTHTAASERYSAAAAD